MAEHANMHKSLAGAVLQFFNTEMVSQGSKATERLKRIALVLNQDTSKLYAHFLSYSLPTFTNANLLFQREDPVLHLLQGKLHDVATDLLVAFVKPSVLAEAKNLQNRAWSSVREELAIGEATSGQRLHSLKVPCLSVLVFS